MHEITVKVSNGKAEAFTPDRQQTSSGLEFGPLRRKTIEVFKTMLAESRIERRRELETLGEHLYLGLFANQVKSFFEGRLLHASRDDRLLLRLQIDEEDPQLLNFPWEYLYCPELHGGFFLSNRVELVLSRYLPPRDEVQEPNGALGGQHAEPVLRIGLVVAEPSDEDMLPVATQEVREALDELNKRRDVQLDILPSPTVDGVLKWLPDVRPHVLHFIGHGGYDKDEGARIVLLEEDGSGRDVHDTELASLFPQAGYTPPVILLHLAESSTAERNEEKNLARLAPALIKGGVPAVVAMQHPIAVRAAAVFSSGFYTALAEGREIDVAVLEGRLVLGNRVPGALDNRVFGTPVLYGRTFNQVVRPLVEPEILDEPPPADEIDTHAARVPAAVPRTPQPGTAPEPSAKQALAARDQDVAPPTPGDAGAQGEAKALVRAVIAAGKRELRGQVPPLQGKKRATVYRCFDRIEKEYGGSEDPVSGDDIARAIRFDWLEDERDDQLRAVLVAMVRTAEGEV